MVRSTGLVWLRNDLRLHDNPALTAACKDCDAVVALYIHETDGGIRQPGGATRWWLHHSLVALADALAEHGIPLIVRTGKAAAILDEVIASENVDSVHWNLRYAPAEVALDKAIKEDLRQKRISATSHQGNVLAEPWTVETGQGRPYSVFSPFWKNLRDKHIEQPLAKPRKRGDALKARDVDAEYRAPAWAKKFDGLWQIGEDAAHRALERFIDEHLEDYPEGRDFPAKDLTSRLSPHLRFGEISPRQIWHTTLARTHSDAKLRGPAEKFLSELAWRDFSYHQLFYRKDIATVPMQEKYAGMAWRTDTKALHAWQKGETGIPIVDAGMRQLWATGYMHNRVRMLVASLLSKNLLVDWRKGEDWFWDCLVDADVANNPASWQWVAGSGLDAAPYFRIFNPATQGERFDAEGDYVRTWVPELTALPDKWIHNPGGAPADVLEEAGITLGKTYPKPIVDLKASRERALEAQAAL